MAPNPANPTSEFSFRTRQQHWDRLKAHADSAVDVAIIGGGIVGAGLLRELCLRSPKEKARKLFLFEKNDFASGTSGASSKLIHAGIRYLEQVWLHLKRGRLREAWKNFVFIVDASRERKILGRIAPGLVHPKSIYFVLSKSDPRYRLSLFAGIWFYYLIQLFQGQFFSPPVTALGPASIADLAPELDASKVKAVFRFWDSETDDARLVIANLQSANALGGAALNYVEVVDYARKEDGFLVTIKDRQTNETMTFRSKRLINASGPFLDEVRKRQKNASALPDNWIDRVAGSHIDIYPAIADRSYYISASDNRLVFALRRDEDGLIYTRVGTTERPLAKNESSERPTPSKGELAYLEGLVKEFFPSAIIRIFKADAGIRPLRSQAGLAAFEKSREHDIIEEDGVLHIAGVKLTDFRRVACEIAGRLGYTKDGGSDRTPLTVPGPIYPETSAKEIVDYTMALHWGDYFRRRRGALPAVLSQQDPTALRKEFDAFADALAWGADRRPTEWEKPL